MSAYSAKAYEYRLLLEVGLIEVTDVIGWADQVLSHCEEYNDDLGFVAGIDDQFQLALRGVYGTKEQAIQHSLNHLSRFKNDTEHGA